MVIKRRIVPVSYGVAGWLLSAGSLMAQIVPDQTLPVNSQVTTLGTSTTISGGTERGVNLYHSFREFSLPTGGAAIFDNGLQIQTILTRVTGSSVSSIDGLLKANGSANLYLLNPKGILFGPNARLEIGGSFFATTANSFKFSDGSEFSATNPQAPPLLTVNLTPGLQTGAIAPGSTIINQGNLIAAQDLTLQADRLDLQGLLAAGRDVTLKAQDTVQIRDTATTPFVASAGRDLTVQGNESVDIFALNQPSSGLWSGGNMVLRSQQGAIGDAHFYAAGNFQVEQLDGSPGSLLSPNDPIILTNGDVVLGNYTGASLHILAGGNVTLGNVTISGSGTAATTINPGNTTLFNGSRSYADLATFNLTDYRASFNADGSVRSIDPVAVPITINGSTQATLDVRAGVDWAALGGLPINPTVVGAVTPTPTYATATSSRADINVNGDVRINQPAGLVLLTNQFRPNTLPGTISIRGNIDTSTGASGANGGDLRVYGRGDITVGSDINTGIRRNLFSYSVNGGTGGAISFASNSGNIKLTNSNSNSNSFLLEIDPVQWTSE